MLDGAMDRLLRKCTNGGEISCMRQGDFGSKGARDEMNRTK